MTPNQQGGSGGSTDFRIAIVGSGPAGLSAAARAQHHDAQEGATSPSYVLLEGFNAHAKTIQQYQKGKHVMDEPGFLDLRSDFDFVAGTREAILGGWENSLAEAGVNIRYGAEVTRIDEHEQHFERLRSQRHFVVVDAKRLAVTVQRNATDRQPISTNVVFCRSQPALPECLP